MLIIVLTVLVFLTGLIDLVFGGLLQIKPEIAAMESNVDYVPELKGLISVWGITLLIFGAITLLSAKWIWKKKREGTILGIFSGLKGSEPDPLYGLYDTTIDGKKVVIECEADTNLLDSD